MAIPRPGRRLLLDRNRFQLPRAEARLLHRFDPRLIANRLKSTYNPKSIDTGRFLACSYRRFVLTLRFRGLARYPHDLPVKRILRCPTSNRWSASSTGLPQVLRRTNTSLQLFLDTAGDAPRSLCTCNYQFEPSFFEVSHDRRSGQYCWRQPELQRSHLMSLIWTCLPILIRIPLCRLRVFR